jgi:protoheme IX farnesyltransferase
MRAAKVQILAYVAAFIAVSSLLTFLGYAGYTYLVVVASLGVAWLVLGLKGFRAVDDVKWATTMFFFSLAVLMGTSAMLALDSLLP